MLSLFTCARRTAISAILCATLAPAAFAADMPFPLAPEPQAVDQPMEFGSGWYLRGDIGPSHVSNLDIDPQLLSRALANNWTIGGGGGYQYNRWFRTEVTVDYESLYQKNGYGTGLLCPIHSKNGVTDVYSFCTPLLHSRLEAITILGSGYVDLGTWYGVTPYVGAGFGVNIVYNKDQVNYFQSNAASYAGISWTDSGNGQTYTANWDRYSSGTTLRFSYAFMGGVAYDVSEHLKLDLGYRWLNMGNYSGTNVYGVPFTKNIIAQQLRMGFRYMID
jgi:opacity protein-like surface antigen